MPDSSCVLTANLVAVVGTHGFLHAYVHLRDRMRHGGNLTLNNVEYLLYFASRIL